MDSPPRLERCERSAGRPAISSALVRAPRLGEVEEHLGDDQETQTVPRTGRLASDGASCPRLATCIIYINETGRREQRARGRHVEGAQPRDTSCVTCVVSCVCLSRAHGAMLESFVACGLLWTGVDWSG